MKSLILTLLLTAGGVLLLSGVVFSQSPPQFGPPQNLGPKINSSFYESDPFWDGPRNRLYFVSARDGDEDIWYSDWTDTGWTDAQKLGSQINSLERELAPSVSPDGQKFYYVTFSRPGATNVWDIWVSTFDSNTNNWGTPVELPCPVNTPSVEFSGRIAPDGKTLLFYSSQSTCDSINQFTGLVSTVWDSMSGWSMPQSLGSNINSGGVEFYPSVTANSKWLYFDRIGSNGRTIFVSPSTSTGWDPAIDLTSQIGARGFTPSVVPSGDSLFFYTPLLGGFGDGDIFVMELIPTSLEDKRKANLPKNFELYQNYPNPFNGQTRISLFVSRKTNDLTSLTVYNVLGQPVRHLFKQVEPMGKIVQVWDGLDDFGREVSNGLYFYELKVGNQRLVKKAIFLK